MAMDAIEMVTRLVKVVRDMTAQIETLRSEVVASEIKLRDEKTVHEHLVRDLCRSLERAQELIVTIGEKSGDPELLKEARVYANAIGGAVSGAGPKPPINFADNPVIKKYWAMLAEKTDPKPKARAKAKAPAKTKAKGKTKPKTRGKR